MPDLTTMITLSLDTTTRAGSVALSRNSGTIALVVGDAARTHGERLPGDIAALLAEARLTVADIELYAVAAGPGSFTGLRVGIAAIQGMALATGRKVVPVSALDALAACDAARAPGAGPIAAWMDAQRGQVFAALYEGARPLRAAVSLPPDLVLEQWKAEEPSLGEGTPVFIGDGAIRYRDSIHRAFPRAIVVEPPPLAPVIARLAVARAGDAVPPHAIAPIYVRAPDAELARDRSTAAPRRTPLVMTARIEPVSLETDLDAIVEIARASFSHPWSRAMFVQELTHGSISRAYVLRTPEHPVAAFCTCWLVADELHINTLAVRPACRRQGLARALLIHVLGDAGASGARRASLEVRRSNEAAVKLYEGLGFTVDSVRRDYYPDPPDDALVLSKVLS